MKSIRYKGITIYEDKPTKDGRKYFFKKYKNGKHYTSSKYKTTDEVEKAYSMFVLKNDNPINKRFDLVADDYFDYMYKTKKESTVYCYNNAYNKHIYPFFKHFYINKVNTYDVRKWAEAMEKKGLSIRYLNKCYDILKTIFDYAIKNYSLNDNPVKNYGRFQKKNDEVIKDEDKIRYITLEEFNKLISVIDNILWKTFFITLFYTGARKSEIQALTWNDFDFKNNEIIINKIISVKTSDHYKITNTKNATNRKIKMSKILKESLLEYKNEAMKYTDYSDNWFVFGCTRFLPQTTIDRKKHLYFNLAGVKEITIHEFRHSHVSLLINEYIKSGQTDTTKFFLMLSNRMGHSIEVMQKTYMHLFPTIQDEIVDLLDNL